MSKIEEIFDLFDQNQIKYFLLRPIELEKQIEDIDIVMARPDVNSLMSILEKKSIRFQYKKMPANESINIIVFGYILDIKYKIGFLPRKYYIAQTQPPSTGIVKKENVIFADSDPYILLTYWIYHLILDKEDPQHSSTYHIFLPFFNQHFQNLKNNLFFNDFTEELFKAKHKTQALEYINHWAKNTDRKPINEQLLKLFIRANTKLKWSILIDKIRIKSLILLGYYKN